MLNKLKTFELTIFQNFVEEENVRVVVRVRPLNKKEAESGYKSIVAVNRINGCIMVRNPQAGFEDLPKTFSYDIVFDTDSKQVNYVNEFISNRFRCFGFQ